LFGNWFPLVADADAVKDTFRPAVAGAPGGGRIAFIINLAQRDRTGTSVGEKAVLVLNAKNKITDDSASESPHWRHAELRLATH
jgi:hypothetical protein